MIDYIKWAEKSLSDFCDELIEDSYDRGFVFTRKFKGSMEQTRSIRVNLEKFEMSSENRRILRKNEKISLGVQAVPLVNYNYKFHKLAKNFYTQKFGSGTMSAGKIKNVLTDHEKSNFNRLFVYSQIERDLGYCICLETKNILHYSYPFYELEFDKAGLGIGMMTIAVNWAKDKNKKYIYLGSYKDASSKYKLQFSGIEWFDGKEWRKDLAELKSIN
ncbi:hypothetical protein JW796_03960 [Candidatus Dojkabacteria bacterium]|nr:hypothetical protein [Candidatus Dojkabacteria bacterium]